jgi:hypothetical protein
MSARIMDRLTYRFYFVLFELLFLLSCAPFVAGLVFLPSSMRSSSIGQLLLAGFGSGVLICLVGSTWMAAISTHRTAVELDSPVQAVLFALNEARMRLAFVPVVGRFVTAKREALQGTQSNEPR